MLKGIDMSRRPDRIGGGLKRGQKGSSLRLTLSLFPPVSCLFLLYRESNLFLRPGVCFNELFYWLEYDLDFFIVIF